jgi:hypothetical protein
MIAGGIFSNYQKESLFSQNMPDLYDMMKNNQDIDIFIHDCRKKFIKYYDRIFEAYLETAKTMSSSTSTSSSLNNNIEQESFENNKIYQGVNAFKITLSNGDKLNFIFVDKREYPSVFSFLNSFDFSLAKIFYSYNTNAIYVPCELFQEYHRIYWKYYVFDFFQKSCSDISSLLKNDFNEYTFHLEKLVKFHIDTDKCNNKAYMNERKLDFMNKNKSCLKSLGKCSKMFYRIVKYGFKNYFKNCDEARRCFEQVNFVYAIFKTQFDNNCFTLENMTESVFCFILKKKSLNVK